MLNISTGLVTDSILLLNDICRNPFCNPRTLNIIHTNHGVNINETISFVSQCGWLKDDAPTELTLSDSGLEIVSSFDGKSINKNLWKKILKSYIKFCKPAWASRILYGRKEAFIYMRPDEKRCFLEANLMDDPPEISTVEWWDNIAADIRKVHGLECEDIGRKGEMLTRDYEYKRTGKMPIWKAIDTNLVGYDFISINNRQKTNQLLIEVKSSTRPLNSATMIISRNEWEVALSTHDLSSYIFYVWDLNKNPRLAKLNIEDISPHVPTEQGYGSWKNFEIPFNVFIEKFEEV